MRVELSDVEAMLVEAIQRDTQRAQERIEEIERGARTRIAGAMYAIGTAHDVEIPADARPTREDGRVFLVWQEDVPHAHAHAPAPAAPPE